MFKTSKVHNLRPDINFAKFFFRCMINGAVLFLL